jgi:beta-glucosidase
MNKLKAAIYTIIPVILLLWVPTKSRAQSPPEEKFLDSLISKMTLQEKIGQLVQWNGSNVEGEKRLRNSAVGSFLNIRNREEIDRLQKIAVEETRLKIPLIIGNDVIHGYHTTFPIPLACAASWNPELLKKACRIAALEAAENGTRWTFAPMVDIARDPRWGRIAEGFGEDPYLASMMAKASVAGFQGVNLADEGSIAACAKHYVAYGAAIAGKDYNTVDMSERKLREVYLPPFHASVQAGISTLMSAFNDLNGVPSSCNYFTLTQILRDEWGFDGFVGSDYNAIGELIFHRVAADKAQCALKAIQAGMDMDLVGDTLVGDVFSPNLGNLVKADLLSEEKINESVRRVLRIKYRLGLFKHPYSMKEYEGIGTFSGAEKNEVALQLARESIVLLKNKNHLLPLNKNVKSIAVIGPLADNQDEMLGTWSCEPLVGNVVTILKGIMIKVPSTTKVNYVMGCKVTDNDRSEFDKAIRTAREADVTVLVVGESKVMSGEAASRSELDLPGVQEELIKKIQEAGATVIVVLVDGRPLTINWITEHIPAIMNVWFLGDQAGNAVADVLFGDYNPSGKLPVTFPRSVGQIPIYYSFRSTGRPFDPKNKFTTKYIDSPVTPLYPFGYGLSYTHFIYSNVRVNPLQVHNGENISVYVDIKNSRNLPGSEVAQFYIRDRIASVTRPCKELKGFQKIYLNPGEIRTIEYTITPDMLSFYDINMKETIEPGMFDVMVGRNSEDVITTSFELVK